MIKRILTASAGVVFIAVIAFWIYWIHLDRVFQNYPDNSVRRITGIQHYRVLVKTHTDFDWHEEIEIRLEEGDTLLRAYPFKQGYSNTVVAGLIAPDYLSDCPTCSYYFKKEAGPFAYLLLVLSADKRHLLVYENFGD